MVIVTFVKCTRNVLNKIIKTYAGMKAIKLITVTCLMACLSVSAWIESTHLDNWYSLWEACMLNDTRTGSEIYHKTLRKECNDITKTRLQAYGSCRIGGVRFGQLCISYSPLSFSEKIGLKFAYSEELDDPNNRHLDNFHKNLNALNGSFYTIGDSQMTNVDLAHSCELERTNSTATNYKRHPISGVNFFNTTDSLGNLEAAIVEHFKTSSFLYIMVNFGVHYNHRDMYNNTLAHVLPTLNRLASQPNTVITWLQSFPQHWNTTNGYWNGKKTACVPIQDTSFEADWRNFLVDEMLRDMALDNIHVIRHREQFNQLHKLHVFGDKIDCTHYCWSPMLYQFLFKSLDDSLKAHMQKYNLGPPHG